MFRIDEGRAVVAYNTVYIVFSSEHFDLQYSKVQA